MEGGQASGGRGGTHNALARRRDCLRESVHGEVIGEDEGGAVELGPAGGGLGEGRRWLGRLRGSVERLRARSIREWRRLELEFQLEVGNGVGDSSLRSERNGRGREQKWARLCFRTEGCSRVGFIGCVARRARWGVAAQGGG